MKHYSHDWFVGEIFDKIILWGKQKEIDEQLYKEAKTNVKKTYELTPSKIFKLI